MNKNIIFGTIIKSDKNSFVDSLGNACFKPVRCLWGGRQVEIVYGRVVVDEKLGLKTSWKITAYAVSVLVLIPGVIFGSLFKLIAYCCNSSIRQAYAIVKAYDEGGEAPQIHVKLFKSFVEKMPVSMLESYKEKEKASEFAREFWRRPEIVEVLSAFMEEAYLDVERMFNRLTSKHDQDPEKMAVALTRQCWEDEQLKKQDDMLYCWRYFRCSLTMMYHMARGHVALVKYKNELNLDIDNTYELPSQLSDEDQAPFFQEGTPQYRWRELYNLFCDKLDKYELRKRLDEVDTRFSRWAKPDNALVDKETDYQYRYPNTVPT